MQKNSQHFFKLVLSTSILLHKLQHNWILPATNPMFTQMTNLSTVCELIVEWFKRVFSSLLFVFNCFVFIVILTITVSSTNDCFFYRICNFRTRSSQFQMCDLDSKLFYISCVYIPDSGWTHFFFLPSIPPCSRYAQWLQSDLTWLAAAADCIKQGIGFYFLLSLDLKSPLFLIGRGPRGLRLPPTLLISATFHLYFPFFWFSLSSSSSSFSDHVLYYST
jgi:hypothetical protein